MRVGDHVRLAINQAEGGEFEASLLHACIAVDGTARKAGYGATRHSFMRVLRDNNAVLGAMALPGIDLDRTIFSNLLPSDAKEQDLAGIVYDAFRCALAHGGAVSQAFSFTPAVGLGVGHIVIAEGRLALPDYLPYGLLGVVVAHPANHDELVPDGYYLTIGAERFPINDWWGRSAEWKAAAERPNPTKVHLAGLDVWDS